MAKLVNNPDTFISTNNVVGTDESIKAEPRFVIQMRLPFLTCHYCNRLGGGRHVLAHVIARRDVDGVHLPARHVVQGAVGVVGGAGDGHALLCHSLHCVAFGASRHVPQHLANAQAVLGGDVLWYARL